MAGFKSFLSAIGHDFIATLKFFGSAQGKTLVAGVENAANIAAGFVNPALPLVMSKIEGLVNNGLAQAASMEASAAAVGVQAGTGLQKGAAVAASLGSQVGDFLKSVGVSDATDAEVQTLATAVSAAAANILNAIPARAAGTATPPVPAASIPAHAAL